MKRKVTLTIMSPLAILLKSFHLVDDIVRWILPLRPRANPILPLLVLAVLGASTSARAQSLAQAQLFFEEGRHADSKTALLALQKANDRIAAVAFYLGRIAVLETNDGEAIAQLQRAVRLEENNALYHYWLGQALYEAAPRTVRIRLPLLAQRVRREWERSVALDPNQLDARAGLAEYYAMAPGFMGGGMARAREQAAEIIRHDAMRGALAQGAIARHAKDTAAEHGAFRRAIAAAPDTSAGYVRLADALVRNGRPADAFEILSSYAAHRPDDPWRLYYYGRLAGTTGLQLDGGDAALSEFLSTPMAELSPPAAAQALYWRGQIAEKRGDGNAARAQYELALQRNPKSHAVRKALAALR